MRKICERDGMPTRRTVFGWLTQREDFCRKYALAREAQADWLFDEMLEIADDSSKDFVMSTTEDGAASRRPDHEQINRSRLRVDTRKWICARLAPKKYGDKVTTELQGELDASVEVDFFKQLLREIDGQSRGFPGPKLIATHQAHSTGER